MSIFEIIGLLEPWSFFLTAMILIAVAAVMGEVSIIPWISLAIVVMGISDFFQLSIENQLIVFCTSFFVSIYLSHRYLSLGAKQPLIAEEIADMVGENITVFQVGINNSNTGSARSKNGKVWNVQSVANENLIINHEYICSDITGVTLIVKGVDYE